MEVKRVTLSCASQFTADDCKAAFESLQGVQTVLCSRAPVVDGVTTYTITFLEFPDLPMQNNVFFHDGNPPLAYFACDKSGVTGSGVGCSVVDVQGSGIRGTGPLCLSRL